MTLFRTTPAAQERETLFSLLLPEEDRAKDKVIAMIGTRRYKHLTETMESNGARLAFRDLLADLSNVQLARLCKRLRLS